MHKVVENFLSHDNARTRYVFQIDSCSPTASKRIASKPRHPNHSRAIQRTPERLAFAPASLAPAHTQPTEAREVLIKKRREKPRKSVVPVLITWPRQGTYSLSVRWAVTSRRTYQSQAWTSVVLVCSCGWSCDRLQLRPSWNRRFSATKSRVYRTHRLPNEVGDR